MNIFGVGGAEFVLIIVIMLIVAGPKRMIRWAYTIGQYVGKFRILWEQMVDLMQEEVDAAGLDVKLPKDIPTRQSIAQTATELLKPYAETLEKTADEVRKPLQETINETGKVVESAKKETESVASSANFGSWDGKTNAKKITEKAQKTSSEPENDPNNFGAWSKPQSTSQQNEAEA